MHGLINRAIEVFLRDTYGQELWYRIGDRAGVGRMGFETMFVYPPETTTRLLSAAIAELDIQQDMLLEDLGTFLPSNPRWESLRRLLRFGGETFREFLYSVDDLPRRANLAVPDLSLPALTLLSDHDDVMEISCLGPMPGFGHVLVGMLRTLADDYGTLVLIDLEVRDDGEERITVRLLSDEHGEARPFQLASGV